VRIGVDTNVLVYAHIPSLPEYLTVRRDLLGRLREPSTHLVLSPTILHELVHVITDGRRFEPPVEKSEALSIGRLYLERENVECLSVGEAEVIRAFQLMERYRLGRQRIADTLFVATLLQAGVTTLLTCNEKDFAVFSEITTIDPRVS
jgi:predicted nucleic acid-binding protein